MYIFAGDIFNHLKKTSYIILLAIILLQAGGMMVIYKFQQLYIQHQMSTAMKSNKSFYEKLTLSIDEYNKCKIKSDEILYKGKMYDIKSIHISGNKVELTVINDKYEEKIITKIKNLLTNTNQNNNHNPVQLQKLFSLVYELPISKYNHIIPYYNININPQSTINFNNVYLDISPPPPKLV